MCVLVEDWWKGTLVGDAAFVHKTGKRELMADERNTGLVVACVRSESTADSRYREASFLLQHLHANLSPSYLH